MVVPKAQSTPHFTLQSFPSTPFNGIGADNYSAPTFADLDGDGDLDLLIGSVHGTLNYYKNTGSAISPVYSQQTGTNDPFNGVDVGYFSTPTFADLDGDGDFDLIVGEYYGTLKYYQNTGSSSAPTYTEQTGNSNPFSSIDVGDFSNPTLADLDSDGDLDAIVGASDGTLRYYTNMGSATSPIYVEQTSSNNPFNGIDVGIYSSPTFADLDGDGDLDAIVGQSYGTLKYYKNTGSTSDPIYEEQTGSNSPFNGINLFSSSPTFADIDGDGDLDAIVGEFYGTLQYFLNTPVYINRNRNPVAVDDAVSTNEDGGLTGNLLSANPTTADSDADGDSLTVSEVNGSAANVGTVIALGKGNLQVNANGTFNFDPNKGYESLAQGAIATETFTYTLSDGNGGSDLATVTVTITGVNDAPIITNPIADQTFNAYSLLNFAIPAGSFTDVDAGDTLTYTASLANGSPLPNWLSFNPATQSFQGIATSEDVGNLSIKVTATDSSASNASVSTIFALNIGLPTTITTNTITGTSSNDILQGTVNNDLINGLDGNDTLMGNTGDDTVNGQGGNDILRGGIGNDILNGGIGNDQLFGDDGIDILIGGDGTDSLNGGIGNDILDGGTGNDLLFGEDGSDTVMGGSGDDILRGGNGDDTLFGSLGNDSIYGDAGSDTLWGGAGSDSLWGGVGSDRFGLQSGQGADTIRDFSLAESDVFVLGSGLSYNNLSISQSGSNTLIKVGTETLATLFGVQSNLITAAQFVS
jgi:VCBS repeat-containing protein